uniref:CRAL-TRIO domain-containing protein n=1 Tax=Clastoptera arizonana TaxID=38151 RepID=A0A1B6DUJ0_9HEMI
MGFLIPHSKEALKRMCKDIQLNPEQMERDVKTLKEWLKNQPHLPHDALDDTMLGSFLTGSKNSLQRAKQCIDKYLTNRLTVPEIYGNRDLADEEILQSCKVIRFFPIPEATPEGYRVVICCIKNQDPQEFVYLPFIKRCLCSGDVLLQVEPHQAGVYYVYDLKGMSFMHMTKLNPAMSKRFIHCGEASMPLRTKGVFIINAPAITETLLSMFKPLLKPKSQERIQVFSGDHTSLYKFIPQDTLPDEYGGKAGKMEDLENSWIKYMMQFNDWFLQDSKRTVDESKRPEKSAYKPTQLFGVEGSFKTLCLD